MRTLLFLVCVSCVSDLPQPFEVTDVGREAAFVDAADVVDADATDSGADVRDGGPDTYACSNKGQTCLMPSVCCPGFYCSGPNLWQCN